MKNTIQRLLSGFISSIMVVSFILMPIPNISISYAEEAAKDCPTEEEMANKGAIYVPGCKLDDSLTQAQLSKPTENVGAWVNIVEQAILGMMGVVLLDNLFYKYQYAYDPDLYGNDCGINKAAATTIRLAQLSALSYIIGDIDANTKFQKASQDAVDAGFAPKAKVWVPDKDSEEVKSAIDNGEDSPHDKAVAENDKQEEAYEALIEVLGKQEKAVKSKLWWTSAAEAGYLGVEVLELASIGKCKKKCTESYNEVIKKVKLNDDNSTEAKQGIEMIVSFLEGKIKLRKQAVLNSDLAKCKELINIKIDKIVNETNKQFNKFKQDGNKTQGEESNESNEETEENIGILAQAWNFIGASTVRDKDKEKNNIKIPFLSEGKEKVKKDEASDNNDNIESINTSRKVTQVTANSLQTSIADVNACKKALNELVDKTDKTKIDKKSKKDSCNVNTDDDACVTENKDYILALKDSVVANRAVSMWKNIRRTKIDKFLASDFSLRYEKTSCCGFNGISVSNAKNVESMLKTVRNIGKPESENPQLAKDIESIIADMVKIQKTYVKNAKIKKDAIDGSFVYTGFSQKSIMSKRRDIKTINIFKKEGSVEGTSGRFNIENVLPIIIENQLYTHVIDNLNRSKKLNSRSYLKQFAMQTQEVSRIGNEIRRYLKKEKISIANFSDRSKVDRLISSLSRVVSKFSIISSAHALDSSGLGGAVIGQGLGMLGGQLGGPWGQVMNVGGQYMSLHGLLKVIGLTELFLKPRSRALTWGALAIMGGASITFQGISLGLIQKRKKVMEIEYQRYLDSAAKRTSILQGRSGGGDLNLRTYEANTDSAGKMNIKTCVSANGNSFQPVSCPSVVPKSRFSIPELNSRMNNHLSPDSMKSLGLLQDTLYGAMTSGNLDGSNFSDGNLEAMSNLNNAMRKAAESERKAIDKMEQSLPSSLKSTPLEAMHAKFKKVFNGKGNNSGVTFDSGAGNLSSVSGPIGNKKEESVPTVTGGPAPTAGGAPVASTPSLDLDFGDGELAEESQKNSDFTAESTKKEEKLDDFVIQHDDISNKKDVSIFKILSNRYILSYPKVLEEEKSNQ